MEDESVLPKRLVVVSTDSNVMCHSMKPIQCLSMNLFLLSLNICRAFFFPGEPCYPVLAHSFNTVPTLSAEIQSVPGGGCTKSLYISHIS